MKDKVEIILLAIIIGFLVIHLSEVLNHEARINRIEHYIQDGGM